MPPPISWSGDEYLEITGDVVEEIGPTLFADSLSVYDVLFGTWGGLTHDVLGITDVLLGTWDGLIQDGLGIADSVSGVVGIVARDTLALSDTTQGHTVARVLVTDRARISDAVRHTLHEQMADSLALADAVLTRVRATVADALRLDDGATGQRTAHTLMIDRLRLKDALPIVGLVEDGVTLTDAALGHLRARGLTVDGLHLSGDAVGAARVPSLVRDTLHLGSLVTTRLHARDLVDDTLALWDELPGTGVLAGQAWTAHASGWAMSRYAPFGFSALAVIDGTVHAMAPDGVYALDGEAETITAELRTGKLDVGGGPLAIPQAAYLEYTLSGPGARAAVDVTTTQAGTARTYSYPLNGRPVAGELTNARALFGRGLRGRHFAYTLRLTGQRAYINDWSTLATPSARRI